MRIGLIVLAGSERQNTHFWPTYTALRAGLPHDLIIVHRRNQHLPKDIHYLNTDGDTIFEDKLDINGQDLAHGAFGAYRKYGLLYAKQYDILGFISDDVLIRRDRWLREAIQMLDIHPKCGFVATQIFHKDKYPHPSHIRSPIWFARSEAIQRLDWDFQSDHDGELKIADQFVDKGYFGLQVGHKFDLAWDSLEKDHICQYLEKLVSPHKMLINSFTDLDIQCIENIFISRLKHNSDTAHVESSYSHIGTRKIISELEPFNGLVYRPSVGIARNYITVKDYNYDIHIAST